MSLKTSKRPVSIITGGASGIGAASARILAARGHLVVCADRDEAAAAEVAEEAGGYAVHLDVADARSCERLVTEVIQRSGRLDSLVHCAGIWMPQRAEDTDVESFERVIGVNLKGTFLIARAVAASMIERGSPGSIVLIGSVNGVRANTGQFSYAVSKGAVLQLGQVLALEWAEHDIRVNIVAPGLTRTGMLGEAMSGPNRAFDAVVARTPMRRVADPAEIAETIEFLVSDRSSFTTGSYVVVDGGWLGD